MADKADELNELDQANNVAIVEAIVANEANFAQRWTMLSCKVREIYCVT